MKRPSPKSCTRALKPCGTKCLKSPALTLGNTVGHILQHPDKSVTFRGPARQHLLSWLLELERSRTAIYQAKQGLSQVNGGL